ncbi:MAG: O-antigen ligase family protein [Patescibacteria group bacterium]
MHKASAVKWLKVVAYVGIYGGLLMPAFFWPVVIFPFVYSKLSFFQFLIGLTFPAYLALAWAEPKYRPRFSILYLAIGAYFLALAASVVFSVDPLRAWWGNQERMNGLFTLLHFFVWLTMAVGMIRTWPQWRRLLNYEIGISVFMAVVALLQKPFPKLLLFQAGERVGGLLDNPIYMAAYQIFNMFFIALLWLKGPNSRMAKLWYVFALLIDVGAFIVAQSRGALVGLGAGILVFLVAYAIMTSSRKARTTSIGIIAICLVSYGVLFAARNTEFVRNSPLERFTNFSVSTRTRFIAWDIAWQGFVERPITGWGLDTFHILFNDKYNPESLHYGYYETWFDRSHNTIMDVLSMTGLFGFVTYVALFIALFTSVIRAYRKKWIDAPVASVLIGLPVGYFVQNVFVFDHPAMFSMSYLLFAFVIAIGSPQFASEAIADDSAKTVSGRNIPWVAFGVLQVVMILLVWKTTVLPFRASMMTIQSNNAFAAGQLDQAYRYAVQAADISTPYDDEQTFLQTRNVITVMGSGQLQKLPVWREWHDLIVRVTEKHIASHPRNAHPHFIFARFTESMASLVPEDAAIAEREYLEAIALSPKRQQLLFGLSRFYVGQGRLDEAKTLLEQVVSDDDALGEGHWLLGLHLFFDRKDFENGAKELVKAVSVDYPYVPKDAREAMALTYAYDALGDVEGLKSIIDLLPTLPPGDSGTYVEIAKAMERQGLIEQRNMILNALARLDATITTRLAPLISGDVSTIQEALLQTEGIAEPSPSQATPTQAVATTSGPGPRAQ